MPTKLTQDEFDRRIAANFGDRLDTSGFIYTNYTCKGIVRCPTHGPYEVSAQGLLNGRGCVKCYHESKKGVFKENLQDFIARAVLVHGERYDYSGTVYNGMKKSLTVLCREHGEFKQQAWSHINGQGCPECGKVQRGVSNRMSHARYISLVTAVHGNEYDLSRISYTRINEKIEVRCHLHGPFYPTANNFLHRKSGCPSCARERVGVISRKPELEYIKQAVELHGERFTYSGVEYKHGQAYLKVVCPEHGEFTQLAQDHLKGVGCSKCSRHVFDTQSFITSATAVHNGRYKYESVEYTGSTAKVTINCDIHGTFDQTPNMHVNESQGCPRCAGVGPSKGQLEVAEFLKAHTRVVVGHKIGRKELDIYLPECGLAVEYHGLIWHSSLYQKDVTRDYKKHQLAAEAGIRVIHIYADEWEFKKQQVSNLLAAAIGVPRPAIYARATVINLVSPSIASRFYSQNHIQGPVSGECQDYGLLYDGEFVAMMSFSRVVSIRGSHARPGEFELRRYATSRLVVGGASRLMAAFMRDNADCCYLISYSDNRLYSGDMYKKLGFRLDHVSKPSYSYVTPNIRHGRIPKARFKRSSLLTMPGFRFDPSLSERANCEANGFYQVHDCGKTRWVLDR